MSDLLFKATDGRKATHGGTYTYSRNRWTRHIDNPVPCESGYHLARGKQVLWWLAPTLWLAESCPDHDLIDHGDKVVSCKIRVERLDTWNDRTARLFAADCADDALRLVKGPDPRSVEAVVVARRFANGDATRQELAAAGAAAWDAAGKAAEAAAVWVAAEDAAYAATREVAYAAAEDAAGAAARAATREVAYAAWEVARDRQYANLLTYLELT